MNHFLKRILAATYAISPTSNSNRIKTSSYLGSRTEKELLVALKTAIIYLISQNVFLIAPELLYQNWIPLKWFTLLKFNCFYP